MSEEVIVQCCAPTLAGIKTGSLFSFQYESKEQMTKELRKFNRILSSSGICILPLRFRNGRALFYLYRPASLQADINKREVRKLLEQAGYSDLRCGECIRRLIRRICDGDNFPHEIGLFLSYPPEDVRGFIENHARNYKFVGYWKVYGDEEKAKKIFTRYKKCTDSYCRRLENGQSLSELAVAI